MLRMVSDEKETHEARNIFKVNGHLEEYTNQQLSCQFDATLPDATWKNNRPPQPRLVPGLYF